MVKLNVLDYAVIDEGKNAETALQESVQLARLAEHLGYKRFWVAEHHDVPAFASSSPEMLMMRILSETTALRLGSGGVMLPHYAPLKVAEQFRMLEAFYPSRVDLGIGNNPGTAIVKRYMQGHRPQDVDYEQRIADVRALLTADTWSTHLRVATAQPFITTIPEMWLLSTSESSARLAARQGMGFTIGTFLLPHAEAIHQAAESVCAYREAFQASSLHMASNVMLATFVVVGDTEEEAERYAQALDVWLLGKQHFAEFQHFPSYETAQDYPLNEDDRALIAQHRARMVIGTPTQVKAQLDTMIERFDADELLIVPLVPTIEHRSKTLTLCANMYKEKG